MTFTEAAAEVLRLVGKPLHYKDITEIAIQRNLLSHVGKSPEVTMGARLAALLKKTPKENPLVRTKPGVFALRAWEESGPPGPAPDADPNVKAVADTAETRAAEGGPEPDADDEPLIDPAPAPRAQQAAEEDDDRPPPAPDEQLRADLAAHAGEVFGEEEGDDQPILGGADEPEAGGGGRRRRRRRRRGEGGAAAPESDGLPGYTVTPAFVEGAEPSDAAEAPAAEARRDERRRDRDDRPAQELDDVAGKDLAELTAWLLGGFDRNGGPVGLRALADASLRRGKLTGDPAQIASTLVAAARADNARRLSEGRRVRFRFSGGRIALTDWALGAELLKLETDAIVAVERYRDGLRRAMAKRVAELSPSGFVELCLSLLDRLGVQQLKPVRRPGGANGEAHFTGVSRSAGGEARVAVVIRKDAREIGRERVTEARGSLHHYGPATSAWLLTAGSVLSGAREEAAVTGAAPVALLDGAGIARACEEHGVGVVKTTLSLALPDAELFEALKGN
ncbi:MAG: restriction endonuclease [Polyangiaceae bacterium]|nr:restriction endonuclease [Polyangiaceae bacterium]